MNHYILTSTPHHSNKRVLALGSFDGFHLGHRAVIDASVALAKELDAEPAVFCFDIPPACYAPGSKVKILADKDERTALFAGRGISSLFVAGFEELRGLDARDLITEILMKECGAIASAASACVVGTFGSTAGMRDFDALVEFARQRGAL